MKTKGIQYEIDIADYCNGNLSNPYPDVLSAHAAIVSEFGSANGVRHSYSESWKGTGVRDPKADLLFAAGNISVKQSGAVQLASGGIKYTLSCFKDCYDEIKNNLSADHALLVEELISTFEQFGPNKMSKQQWATWSSTTGRQIDALMKDVWDRVPEFREVMVDEVLSGRRYYKTTPKAVAKYILTPNKIHKINKKYVQNISPCVKIRIAAKGRSKKVNGVKQRYREAVVRFDYKT